jgi:ArsR family transcriptional regulator, arsenate/arsenite/antimonite-responsive transcriptional repressor
MHSVNIRLHEIFQALSDPYRIRIVRLMLAVKGEICLCEISESLDEPEYKLSRHIKILKTSGLLNSVRGGKWIYHSLVKDQKFLLTMFKALTQFDDTDRDLKLDLARFNKRLKLRENGRCQVPSRVGVNFDSRVKA